VWPGAAEGESKQEEGDAAASVAAAAAAPVLVDSGVAAPVLLQAVASLWAVSAASVLGLFGMRCGGRGKWQFDATGCFDFTARGPSFLPHTTDTTQHAPCFIIIIISGSSESPTEKGPEADKLQELPRVAEARGREAASTLPQ